VINQDVGIYSNVRVKLDFVVYVGQLYLGQWGEFGRNASGAASSRSVN